MVFQRFSMAFSPWLCPQDLDLPAACGPLVRSAAVTGRAAWIAKRGKPLANVYIAVENHRKMMEHVFFLKIKWDL